LGGSFNPAHRGHLHLSLTAFRHLDLDEIWWLVSPQNPLKPVASMAPFADRFVGAQRVAAAHPRIRVSDFEARLRTRYTADTLKALRRRFPRIHFVWLMGSDNLAQLRHWQCWPEIFATIPIAVFDRPSYSANALAQLPAQRFARRRLKGAATRHLAEASPPAWAFFHTRLDPTSATEIRSATHPIMEQRPALSSIATLTPRPRIAPSPTLLGLILRTLEDGKAEDIVTIDLAGKTTIADQMVVASGRSARQVSALTEHLEQALAHRARISVEGKEQADWVLIDAGDVIVHLFRPEIRAYYNLEKLWAEAFPDSEAARQ
jgi:nicotinate-nucleotide adenylyltransferase